MDIDNELKSYTLREVAPLVGLSVRTLRNHLSADREPWASLPIVKIGRKVLIPHAALVAWMGELGLGPAADARRVEKVDSAVRRGRGRPPRASSGRGV